MLISAHQFLKEGLEFAFQATNLLYFIYLFMLATQIMNSLSTSFLWNEKYEKKYNCSYVRIKHIEIISLIKLTCYILVDDPISCSITIQESGEASYHQYNLPLNKGLSLTFFSPTWLVLHRCLACGWDFRPSPCWNSAGESRESWFPNEHGL